MRLPLIIYGLLAYAISLVSTTALTYRLAPNEKACFFTYVEQKNVKVAFYFAVSSPSTPQAFSVSGLGLDRSLMLPRFNRAVPLMLTTASSAPTTS